MQPDANVSRLSGTTIEDLMAKYQQADVAAAATLVYQLSPRLHRFFASQLGSPTDAADMLQETWLRIHRVRHTYRPGAPLLPWVYTIAQRVRIDSYRRRRRASREVAVDVLPEPPSHDARSLTGRSGFTNLLASLPESQKEVLTMLKLDGLSIDQIAQATSSTTGAVKQKAHRAYERLRKLLHSSRAAGLGK